MGITSVFLTQTHPFNPREFWETVEREKTDMAIIIGDAFSLPMLEELRRAEKEGRTYNLKHFGALASSGMMWSPHLKKELQEFIPNLLILDAMGTTEVSTAFPVISSPTEKEKKMAGAEISRERVYGYQIPCRVLNHETGKDVKPGSGEIGEFVCGGWMTLGYWKCPKKTAHDFKIIDGKRWFFSGDEGTLDGEGHFTLIGRGGGYLINTGGEKVYSEEVEGIIKGHPKVRDVGVLGIPDERWGEAVTALIELRPGVKATEDEIKRYCRTRMTGYKKPKHVLFVRKIPRTTIGKLIRTEGQRVAMAKIGMAEEELRKLHEEGVV